MGGMGIRGLNSIGEWKEFRRQGVIDGVWRRAGNPDFADIRELAKHAAVVFDDAKAELQSLLSPVQAEYPDDKFLGSYVEEPLIWIENS
mgnify:FL=1